MNTRPVRPLDTPFLSRFTISGKEMKMSTVYLKVKIKSLAVEAAIIRKEENRIACAGAKTDTWWSLRYHRIQDVRSEARSAQLAYAMLRNRPYQALEAKCYEKPNVARIAELVRKYGALAKTREEIFALVKAWLEIA